MQDHERGRGRGGGADLSSSSSSNGGWPLGLQPLHVHIQMLNVMSRAARSREAASFSFNNMAQHPHHHHHQLRYLQGEASPFFLSTYTPSISSLSSSDLDTESTGSFFPERSTTLGTLIGIHSRAQRDPPPHGMDNVLLQSKHMTKSQRLHACWCALTLIMKCACSNSDVNPTHQQSFSPSLAHLLDLERKAAHAHEDGQATPQCETVDDEDNADLEDANNQKPVALPHGFGECSHPQLSNTITLLDLSHGIGECSHPQISSTNTLFDNDGILPPKPSGCPSKVSLSTSPTTSSYISTDWSAGVPIVKRKKQDHSSQGLLYSSLCPSFYKLT